jgi:hypothetical protein
MMMRTYDDGAIDPKGMYEFVLAPEGDQMHIKIVEGEYKDVIYRYGKVGFNPDEGDINTDEDERLTMVFDYDIISLPMNLQDVDLEDEQFYNFENVLGDILIDIIEHDLESKNKDAARNSNTETPISQ